MRIATSKIIISLAVSITGLVVATQQWGANGLQSSATVILVAITAWYADQMRRSIEETKRSRKRPYVLTVLVEGIDPLLDQIQNNNEKTNPKDNTRGYSYPYLTLEHEIPEEIAADLEKRRSQLIADYGIYRDLIYSYHWAHSDLLLEIRDHIEEEFEYWIENRRENLPDRPPVTFRGNDTHWEDLPYRYATPLAEWALYGRAPSNEVYDIFKPFEEDLMRVHEEEFKQEFSNLDAMINDIRPLGLLLKEDLDSVRNSYLREYDISETEIKAKSN